jgi:hypothetical protein
MSQLRSFAIVVALSGTFAVTPNISVAQTTQANRTPVLVELFTSEGCSSCPPADALLAKLEQEQPVNGAEIIVLGEHVDYWDKEGWLDRFSSHEYTFRQTEYGERLKVEDVYTPQMIVDGTTQFTGNDASHALKAIQHAALDPKIQLTVSRPVVDGHKVSASVSAPAAPTTKTQADIYVALVDPKDTTDVRSGENGGRRLQHVAVVRSLRRVGDLKHLDAGPVSFTINAPGDAKPSEMRLVVFAQQKGPGAVVGAVSTPVTP